MIKKIIREEGFSAFFKGVLPAIIMTINPVIQYIIYEYLRLKLKQSDNTLSVGNILWTSILSKLITTIITYPMLTIKTLFQSNDHKSNKEIFDIILSTLKEKGILGLYRGINAKMSQTLINNAITMVTYEKIYNLLKIAMIKRNLANNIN